MLLLGTLRSLMNRVILIKRSHGSMVPLSEQWDFPCQLDMKA
jgi:hypothetical protein